MRQIRLVAAALLMISPLVANADIITFEGESGYTSSIGGSIDIAGFRFTLDVGSSTHGFALVTSQSNIVDSGTRKLFGANHAVITMTRIDGMNFNLGGFDLGGSFDTGFNRWASSVDVFGSDGSMVSGVVGPAASYNSIAAAFSNIASVRWAPVVNTNGGLHNYEYTLDNIEWSAASTVRVPEPGGLALLGIGLFGLGLTRRRKKI